MRLLAIIEAASLTGPAKNLLDFCARSRGAGVEARLITFRRGDAAHNDEFLAAAERAGIAVSIVREAGRFDTAAVDGIKRIAGEFHPDIIQTHAVKSHFLVRWSGLWKHYPWIAFHHGYTFTDLKMKAYNMLDRWSLRAPAGIVTVSEAFERQLVAAGIDSGRIKVLHNAVESDWVRKAGYTRESARQQLGFDIAERIVLGVGRFSREKDFGNLIHAFARLRSKWSGPALRLAIAGDGPERPAMESLSDTLGVRGGVTFAGAVSPIAPWFAAADCLAISSFTEGSPNALLEAMAASLPVVATRVGGIPEIVKDGESALLVPPMDSEALAVALDCILADEALANRLARRAMDVVRERYDPDGRVRTLVQYYRGLTDSGAANARE